MKKQLFAGTLAASVLLLSGCWVCSLQPWLSEESVVGEPSLAGTWIAVQPPGQYNPSPGFMTFTLEPGETPYYDIMSGNTRSETDEAGRTNHVMESRDSYAATLHSIDGTLFLSVGPGAHTSLDKGTTNEPVGAAGTIIPAFVLLRVELTNDIMSLYVVDRESFEKRLRKSGISTAARKIDEKDRNKDEPIIVTSLTEDVEKFVRKNLKDKTFFAVEPYGVLARVKPESPQAPAATNAAPGAAGTR